MKVIIVGGTRGIGLEIARQLVKSGHSVVVLGRSNPGDLPWIQHDVLDTDSIPAAFQQAADQLGGIDVFIYSSGYLDVQEPTEFNTFGDLQMIDINARSAVVWLNLVARRFQATKRGMIVGISSVAGDRGRAGYPVYGASKAFLTSYLESLRNRLGPLGVKVVTIKPGPVGTEMTAHLPQSNMMPVEVAAAKIIKLMNRPGEHYLKLTHRVIFWIIRHLPSFVMQRIKR